MKGLSCLWHFSTCLTSLSLGLAMSTTHTIKSSMGLKLLVFGTQKPTYMYYYFNTYPNHVSQEYGSHPVYRKNATGNF